MQLNGFNIFNERVDLFDSLFPIGYVYEQLPGQKSPIEMYGELSEWMELDYGGAFFCSYDGNPVDFETTLDVESVNETTVTFVNIPNLSSGQIIYDFEHNESRTITGLGGARIVYINAPFSNTDVSKVIVSQADSMRSHSHPMNHGHSASSSSSCEQSFYFYGNISNNRTISGDPNNYARGSGGSSAVAYGVTLWGIPPYIDTYPHVDGVSTSTSVTDYNGNTGYTGDSEVRPNNFTVKLWKRIA